MPSAWVARASAMLVRSAGKAGHGPSSILEIASPSSSLTRSAWSGGHDHVVAVELDLAAQPLEARRVMRRSSATTSLIRSSPPVQAASAMKLPTSM